MDPHPRDRGKDNIVRLYIYYLTTHLHSLHVGQHHLVSACNDAELFKDEFEQFKQEVRLIQLCDVLSLQVRTVTSHHKDHSLLYASYILTHSFLCIGCVMKHENQTNYPLQLANVRVLISLRLHSRHLFTDYYSDIRQS